MQDNISQDQGDMRAAARRGELAPILRQLSPDEVWSFVLAPTGDELRQLHGSFLRFGAMLWIIGDDGDGHPAVTAHDHGDAESARACALKEIQHVRERHTFVTVMLPGRVRPLDVKHEIGAHAGALIGTSHDISVPDSLGDTNWG